MGFNLGWLGVAHFSVVRGLSLRVLALSSCFKSHVRVACVGLQGVGYSVCSVTQALGTPVPSKRP